ncbi:MAG TPA: VOC family protein [Kineosporiaceae bacterium]|nr:VOC family protein [Kineosporiaceae bacterium]
MSIRWLTIFFDLPSSSFDPAAEFWLRVTGGECSARRGPEGEFATVLPPDGDAYLRIQRVRDGSGGRHLDLHVDLEKESLAQVAARAVVLGARVRHVEAGLTVLDSPGGFTFCLVNWDGEATVPSPIRSDTGSANRLDQLCLDIPPDRFEAEGAFWSTLTGWELRTGSLPEFNYLERPAGIPVRLLLQRRAQAGPQELVSAHVDVACDDVRAVCESHVAAGAQVAAEFAHWLTMTDPIGQPYCLTSRNPLTGTPTGQLVRP